MLERALERGEPGERRQQRGMDVEHALGKRREQRVVQPPHEAGEQHRADSARGERVYPDPLVLDAGAEAAGRQCHRRHAEAARAPERLSVGRVAHEQLDRAGESGST